MKVKYDDDGFAGTEAKPDCQQTKSGLLTITEPKSIYCDVTGEWMDKDKKEVWNKNITCAIRLSMILSVQLQLFGLFFTINLYCREQISLILGLRKNIYYNGIVHEGPKWTLDTGSSGC